MSQDEQLRELCQFQQSLIRFNEQLQASLQELEQHYRSKVPQGEEPWHREDEAILQRLQKGLQRYFAQESPHYVDLLTDEIRTLQEEPYV